MVEGDALKYMKPISDKGEENLMEIVELRGSVEVSLIEISGDDIKISLTSLFAGSEE